MTTSDVVESPTGISVAVEGLWATSRMRPQQIPYNEAVSVRTQGHLEPDALRQAFNALVRRYDAWHTVIDLAGSEPALIAQSPMRFALPVIDLRELDAEAAERQAVRIVAGAARVPYDLSRGPLIRPRLLRFPADEHRLYLAMHHAIFDGVSLARTFLPDLVALYDAFSGGPDSPLEEPRTGYGDFARWERQWMATERATRRVEYWRRRMTPAPPRLSLPTDQPRSTTARHRGGTLPARVPPATAAALRTTARTSGNTEFQIFGAIWAALLHRLTAETDIVFGTPADLRRRSEFQRVVGYCLSPLILRVDLSDDPTVDELTRRVRNDLLDGLDHLIPFERIVRDQNLAEADGGNPVYRTMLVLEPAMAAHDPMWSLHQLDSALAHAVGVAKLDLELQLDARPDGSFVGQLNYDRDLFAPETAERVIVAWGRIVEAVALDPGVRVSELELRDAMDEARVAEFNSTVTERPAATVPERLAEVAGRQPLEPAVSADGRTVSYDELHRASLAGAGVLRNAGVRDGDSVAVCLKPSVALVAAALATLSAGAAVLLLNPADPPEVLRASASSAGCAAVIVDEGAGSPFEETTVQPIQWTRAAEATPFAFAVDVNPDLPCMLQQGPGQPGVTAVLSRETVDTFVSALVSDLGLGPGDSALSLPEMLYASPCTELWPILLAGGRLVLSSPDGPQDGRHLSKLIRAEGVTFLHATSTRWEGLIETGLRSARGLGALCGGEPISRELADRLLERCRVVWSAHAPAAPGGYCTLGRVVAPGPATIGRPIANHRAHVVDRRGRPLPIGFVGELLVAGPLATSDDPEESLLIPEPGRAGLARRTGRRARWLGDGHLSLTD